MDLMHGELSVYRQDPTSASRLAERAWRGVKDATRLAKAGEGGGSERLSVSSAFIRDGVRIFAQTKDRGASRGLGAASRRPLFFRSVFRVVLGRHDFVGGVAFGNVCPSRFGGVGLGNFVHASDIGDIRPLDSAARFAVDHDRFASCARRGHREFFRRQFCLALFLVDGDVVLALVGIAFTFLDIVRARYAFFQVEYRRQQREYEYQREAGAYRYQLGDLSYDRVGGHKMHRRAYADQYARRRDDAGRRTMNGVLDGDDSGAVLFFLIIFGGEQYRVVDRRAELYRADYQISHKVYLFAYQIHEREVGEYTRFDDQQQYHRHDRFAEGEQQYEEDYDRAQDVDEYEVVRCDREQIVSALSKTRYVDFA